MIIVLLGCAAGCYADQILARGEIREDEGFLKVEFSFDPAGGPVKGTITLDSTGPNLVTETIDWYGKKQEVTKKIGEARTQVNLTFVATLQGSRMTGKTSGSMTYETIPERRLKHSPVVAPGQPRPAGGDEYVTVGKGTKTTVSLEGQAIEAEFDFAAGKAGGFLSYPRAELMKSSGGNEPTSDRIPWEAAFPPQKVAAPAEIPVVIKDGWKGVAADGVSVLELIGTLPQGFVLKSGAAMLVARVRESERKTELKLESAGTAELRVRFEAPSVIDEPFSARVDVSGLMTDTTGATRPFHGRAAFDVVQPPVGLVHGVWSNREAWENGLRSLNAMRYDVVSRFNYAGQNNGNPETIAGQLQQWLDSTTEGPFALAKHRGILASKVDLVGHSLGGLIVRRLVADDPGQNKGLYKRVRRVVTVGTPHMGAPFADWFIYFARSRKKPTDEDRELHPDEVLAHPYWLKGYRDWNPESFHWLVKTVREKKKLDNSFFQDGDAVFGIDGEVDRLGTQFREPENLGVHIGAAAELDASEAGATEFFEVLTGSGLQLHRIGCAVVQGAHGAQAE
ncbi:MAG TPA: alpha/beta fold hydrolase, partial [Candidatus Ozemobacteraceae bacterium]|nr:alpha/beta fold hydrolase [Candidatus Ozemobacteraceae bacterium]